MRIYCDSFAPGKRDQTNSLREMDFNSMVCALGVRMTVTEVDGTTKRIVLTTPSGSQQPCPDSVVDTTFTHFQPQPQPGNQRRTASVEKIKPNGRENTFRNERPNLWNNYTQPQPQPQPIHAAKRKLESADFDSEPITRPAQKLRVQLDQVDEEQLIGKRSFSHHDVSQPQSIPARSLEQMFKFHPTGLRSIPRPLIAHPKGKENIPSIQPFLRRNLPSKQPMSHSVKGQNIDSPPVVKRNSLDSRIPERKAANQAEDRGKPQLPTLPALCLDLLNQGPVPKQSCDQLRQPTGLRSKPHPHWAKKESESKEHKKIGTTQTAATPRSPNSILGIKFNAALEGLKGQRELVYYGGV